MAEELETKVENTEETHDSNNEGRQWYVEIGRAHV